MAGSRGFAVSDNGDHVGCYSDFDQHVGEVSQLHQLRGQNHHHQVQVMAVDDVCNETHSGDSDAALSIPPVTSDLIQDNKMSNLDRFLESVTPIVPARLLEVDSMGQVSRETDISPYYCLGDLWESFHEWSAFGTGVPFLLYGTHPTTQYYVPFLSGMQLYVDPGKVGDNNAEACSSRGKLAFEFMEREQPHTRKTLAEKASVLVSQFPELSKYRSCDLSPSSWICVAWYPIYRIPVGPTLKDLEASFLTLHSLSTQPRSYSGSESSSRNADGVRATLDLSSEIHLPVIGLVSYKLKGSIISPCDPQEREKENALFEAANNWLQNLQATLPDYQFFLKRY